MEKFEVSEIINLIFSVVFFFILITMLKNRRQVIPQLYIMGTIMIVAGNIFTVFEAVFLPVLFNHAEHISFTLGTVFFFGGTIKLLVKNDRAYN